MNTKSKTIAIFISAIMLISIGASTLLPSASARENIPTYAYVAALPDHVGVGQEVMIYMWIDKLFPNADMDNDYRFHNFKLVITKPDGSTETKTWETIWDTTSNQQLKYVPTMNGTYHLNFTFPAQSVSAVSHLPGATENDTYAASTASTTFTVSEEPIPSVIDTYPLPSEYWTRPIYGENSIWYLISSNWLGTGAPGYGGFAGTYNYGGNNMMYPADAVGPETAHIMWTKPLQSGGVVGGNNFKGYEGNTYFEGSAYLQRFTNPIIVNGKLYYTEPVSYLSPSGGPTKCVDLRTGQVYWSRTDVPALSHAIIFDAENPNQHGVYNALLVAQSGGGWTGLPTTWRFFDADTGNPLFNATNIPSGRKAMGPLGEYLIYNTMSQAGNYVVRQWNSSKMWTWTDTPSVTTGDASTAARFDWVKPITYNGANWTTPFTVVEAYYDDIMLCYNGTLPSTGSNFFFGSTETYKEYTYFAVNLNASKGTIGNILWMKNYLPPVNATILQAGVDPVNRVFVENVRELNAFIGYNLDTGARIWNTLEYPQTAMDYYGSPASGSLANMFAYGKMYSSAYAGIVYCYDTTNGKLLWTYGNGGPGNSTDGGLDVPGRYPTFINAYGNGIIYLVTTEHTIETPLYKGSLFRAINATTGEEVWTLNGYVGEFMTNSYAIADGYATWFNGLDNQIYSVGRGPSAMTVSAPNLAAQAGQKVVIRGTVTDISAGTTQSEQAARFPNGVPVASDASMKDWMGYVYQQKPCPTSFTGVEVTINVLDANGNYRSIGTTTTDAYGVYSLSWLPDIPGDYRVIATFAGTKGYWPSSAETSFTVSEPEPSATPIATPEPTAADLYFVPAIVGLFVAIIVVGLLLALLLLRKRP
ncbi:MAG: PQQ-binding-like beta-propeller repeat protein [Candidatus Bathyarchaeota archaeon]|nr:PQQ-binding-like beta-propeller repeat protein [Candidatus Bathyarchaeota archaeon]